MNDPTVVAEPVRCLFEGPSSSCDQQPSEAEMNLMVLFLLEGTNDKCTATEVKQATSALTTIFKMPQCIGMTPCKKTTVATTSSTATTVIADSTTTATTSSATATSTTKEEEDSKLLPTTTILVSTTYTPAVNEPIDETTVTRGSHQKAIGNSSYKRNMLPLIFITRGLVVISVMVACYYRKKNTKSSIIYPNEESVQSIDSKSTNVLQMSGSVSSDNLESLKISSLANVKTLLNKSLNTYDTKRTMFCVFLFRQGTEQPHQSDMNNSTSTYYC